MVTKIMFIAYTTIISSLIYWSKDKEQIDFDTVKEALSIVK